MNEAQKPSAGVIPVDGQVRPVAEALRLAEYLQANFEADDIDSAANELRRLHALRVELQAQVEDLKAERNRARLAGELEATKRERERCAKLIEDYERAGWRGSNGYHAGLSCAVRLLRA